MEGHIQYRYANATLKLKEARVDDGRWHHVEIKWMSGEVWINLDYGNHEDTLKVNAQVSNHYIGTVSVGGVQPSDQAKVTGFKGCIKVILIHVFKILIYLLMISLFEVIRTYVITKLLLVGYI